MDETYFGGLEEGKRGRQTEKKALIVVTVATRGSEYRVSPDADLRCFAVCVLHRTGQRRGIRTAGWATSPWKGTVTATGLRSAGPGEISVRPAVTGSSGHLVFVEALAAGYRSGREVPRERVRAGLVQARQNRQRLGRPATAVFYVEQVRKLRRPGLRKSEIARQLEIGRTSVRHMLAAKGSQRRWRSENTSHPRGPNPRRGCRGRLWTPGACHGLVLLPGGQNPIPIPGQMRRDQSGLTAPQRRNDRSSRYGSRRGLLERHGRAH